MGIFNLDGHSAGFFGRIVVSTREQGIPDKNHLLNRNAKGVAEFSNPVGFIDTRLGDINGCRTAQSDGKLGNKACPGAVLLLPLGEIRIPLFLFFKGSLLPNAENVI